jgi:hypothetical protein
VVVIQSGALIQSRVSTANCVSLKWVLEARLGNVGREETGEFLIFWIALEFPGFLAAGFFGGRPSWKRICSAIRMMFIPLFVSARRSESAKAFHHVSSS